MNSINRANHATNLNVGGSNPPGRANINEGLQRIFCDPSFLMGNSVILTLRNGDRENIPRGKELI